MNADRAHAAGQGGIPQHSQTLPDNTDLAPASQDAPLHPPSQESAPQQQQILLPLSSDERHRQAAAEQLAGYLATASGMLKRCDRLSDVKRGDKLGPIFAAARLMNSTSQVARVLAQVALVERRSRTIVETVQTFPPKKGKLNSPFSYAEGESPKEVADARVALENRLDELLAAAKRYAGGEEDDSMACCI